MRRVLVAGLGNIFRSDDGFGVEVAQRLSATELPAGVEVVDVGIRSIHLAYQLLDGYDTLVLVDAVQRGDPPGTLTVLEPDAEVLGASLGAGTLDPHDLDPVSLLATVSALGGRAARTLVVGCEAADVGDGIGLSARVAAVVPDAVALVERVVDDIGRGAALVSEAKEQA